MIYDVYDFNNHVVGQVDAFDPVDARAKARELYGIEILDVKEVASDSETSQWKPLGGITYHYSTIRASWIHDDKKWSTLMSWARQQSGFWWNHMAGPLEMIAFNVEAAGLRSFCKDNGISHDNFKIYVGPEFGPY